MATPEGRPFTAGLLLLFGPSGSGFRAGRLSGSASSWTGPATFSEMKRSPRTRIPGLAVGRPPTDQPVAIRHTSQDRRQLIPPDVPTQPAFLRWCGGYDRTDSTRM